MMLYDREVIQPNLRGTLHRKIFSIWGDDFAFSQSDYAYTYLTKLMRLFSEHSMEVWNREITWKFATVQEYFDDVKALNNSYPFYHGDFMPYIQLESGTFDHWVGYYSSTPTLKKMI